MASFFRFDIANLLGSAARGLIRPSDGTEDPVVSIADILDPTTLDAAEDWVDVGAAREGQGSTYERNIQVQEWNIEQSTAAIDEDVTDIPRSITLQFAEFSADKVAVLENSGSGVVDVDPVTDSATQQTVSFGSVESLDRFTVALVGKRRQGRGRDITDTEDEVRGELVAWVLHSATVAATNASMELQKGQLANVPLEFRGFPHPGVDDPRDAVGIWITEVGPETIEGA